MRSLIFIAAAAATIVGCVSMERSPALGDAGNLIFEKDAYGNEFIVEAKYSYKLANPTEKDALPLCVSQIVENRSVGVKGNTTSIGPYTGRLYTQQISSTLGGGQVIRYVSDDRKKVIAEGAATYETGSAFVSRNVRYVLTAKTEEQALNLSFGKLEHVQLDSGVASNNGYGKIGSWAGATPDKALEKIKSVAEALHQCLTHT
ncbi:hypothetical protein N5J23_11080 [Comamonas aquatica]|uniref:Uncharacterized protein n=1 Tax=Comamonas aquatica TaxID=225991 RepID=A0AA42W3X5_9BURK|nr:hypothetical protein [Comamonas aquatica]MDE1557027.1 hypothetical protein [Comamonas aquatica]MDH1428032.1 hypothetical protein [Comamonas aquatica]MDH1606164.1 hypothetical protein [Comamonas aquatica]MDH1617951.1 hypothetical protein [Comamonas aquatica]MDH2006083.1 hypothetical protein [Comamonas aquatica]